MAVIVQAQPWRTSALTKYLNIKHRVYSCFLSSTWLKYNEMFHMRTAVDPTYLWDRKDTEVWAELVMQDRSANGQQLDSGRIACTAGWDSGRKGSPG